MKKWKKYLPYILSALLLIAAMAIFIEAIITFFVRNDTFMDRANLHAYEKQINGYGMELCIKVCISFLMCFIPLIVYLAQGRRKYREEKNKMEKLINGIPGGVFISDADEKEQFSYISPGLYRIFEYDNEKEFRHRTGNRMISMVYPPDRERVRKERSEQLQKGSRVFLEFRIETKYHTIRWIDSRSELVCDSNGKHRYYTVLLDITEQHFLMEKLVENEERQRLIMEKSDNIFLTWDFKKDHVVMAESGKEKLGYPCDTPFYLAELRKRDRIHPEDYNAYRQVLREIRDGKGYSETTVRFKTAKGNYIWLRFSFMCQRDNQGNPISAFGIATNVDADMRRREELISAAETDSLTGIYNKLATQKHIDQIVRKKGGALVILDLDNFKGVNDTYGHLTGDHVLMHMAHTMNETLGPDCIAGRIGGDEFALFAPAVGIAEKMVRHVQEKISRPTKLNGEKIKITCSVGIAAAARGETFENLYPKADIALYQAKKSGKNCYMIYEETQTPEQEQAPESAGQKTSDSTENKEPFDREATSENE